MSFVVNELRSVERHRWGRIRWIYGLRRQPRYSGVLVTLRKTSERVIGWESIASVKRCNE
jgi:hypothetical protein